MVPIFKQQRCPVHECGAVVFLADVNGRTLALNPAWVDVVVPDEQGRLRLTRGLLPHGTTCVDIAGRVRRAATP